MKGFTIGTLVSTDKGLIPIEKLKVGDMVLTHTNKYRKITEIKKEKGLPEEVASNEMCTFLILNISSLQLIPVSVIAYRSQYGSSNPSAITGAAIAATLVSTATAVIFCKIKEKMTKDTF